jgi:hypothetical protein
MALSLRCRFELETQSLPGWNFLRWRIPSGVIRGRHDQRLDRAGRERKAADNMLMQIHESAAAIHRKDGNGEGAI